MNLWESERFRGYFFVTIATLANASVFIFSKAALNELHLAQFGFYWFGMGIIWNVIYTANTCKWTSVKHFFRHSYGILAGVALLELVGVTSFFAAIKTIENPSVTSFLGNIGPIFVTILGISFLRERFNIWEGFGMFLILIGAFVISYKKQTALSDIFIDGTQYVLIASLFFALASILVRKTAKNVPPALMSLNRVFYIFTFATVMLLTQGYSFNVSSFAFLNLAIGSIIGPFLTVFTTFSAFKYMEASRVSIIKSTKGFVVLIGAYVYFGSLPMEHQIIGGVITIIGIILLSTGKQKIAQYSINKIKHFRVERR
ncbi:MAG: DMT family transporter [Bacteroidales bacterium]|nr:DMT family transporter [Bacteroidales bacterium]